MVHVTGGGCEGMAPMALYEIEEGRWMQSNFLRWCLLTYIFYLVWFRLDHFVFSVLLGLAIQGELQSIVVLKLWKERVR